MNGYRKKREIHVQKTYHPIEHFRLFKVDYSLYFFNAKNFFFLAHLSTKYDFFTVQASQVYDSWAKEPEFYVTVGHSESSNIEKEIQIGRREEKRLGKNS
jgi:hypothetical protein